MQLQPLPVHRKLDIAIIYFSRTSSAESKEKQWFRDRNSSNENIAHALVEQSYKAVSKLGLPIFHFHEGNQKGKTFGEKLANAYSEVFELGYSAAIAVGNDSPELQYINWANALAQLANGQSVLGPSIRGGAYFIGLTKQDFDKENFETLPWQTDFLFAALRGFCTNPYIIEKLRDINSLQDLWLLLKSSKISSSFKKLLLFLFNLTTKTQFEWHQEIQYNFYSFPNSLRAPPVLL